MRREFGFYEFFAGGGMARAGLGEGWKCLYANDKDDLKAKVYASNWGEAHFDHRDIGEVRAKDLGEMADLAWASFPCQDLSVAGAGLGIGLANGSEGTRSGALWPFLDLMAELKKRHRQPPLIVLENVVGLLTLEGGRDFAAICESLSRLGYRFGAVVIDARNFVAQSRPRVFIVAVQKDVRIPRKLQANEPVKEWHTKILQRAFKSIDARFWLVQAFGSYMVYGPSKARHDDHSLAIYEMAGFTGATADQAATAVFLFVLGNTLVHAAAASLTRKLSHGGGNAQEVIRDSMAKARETAAQFPRLRARIETAAADYAAAPDNSFEFGLQAILDGIEAQLITRRMPAGASDAPSAK